MFSERGWVLLPKLKICNIAVYGGMIMQSVETLIPKYMTSWNWRLLGKGRRIVQGNHVIKAQKKIWKIWFWLKREDAEVREKWCAQIKQKLPPQLAEINDIKTDVAVYKVKTFLHSMLNKNLKKFSQIQIPWSKVCQYS